MRWPRPTLDTFPNAYGGCTVCCTLLAVPELSKPPQVTCREADDSGRRRYAMRPGSCRSWSCLWAEGLIPADAAYRPDLLGLVFDLRVVAGRPLVMAFEVWAGASESEKAAGLLDDLARQYHVLLISPGRVVSGWRGKKRIAGLFDEADSASPEASSRSPVR